MKILVTGAGGFVGNALCRHLAASGHGVIGVFRENPAPASWMESRIVGDLQNIADFAGVVEGADAVVHLAARVHMMRETAADPEAAFIRANTDVTEKLARAASGAGTRAFVFLSSVKVNGEATNGALFTETDDPAPEDAYGRSKLAAETALRKIAANSPMSITTLRIPLVYGPGVRANFAALLRVCDLPLPLPLGGIAGNRRSLLYVGNLIHAIERVLDTGGKSMADESGLGAEIFFLSDGEDMSTADLVRRLRRCLNRRFPGIAIPAGVIRTLAHIAGKASAADRLCGSLQIDPARFAKEFGWIPPFSVDQGLAATAASHRIAR